MKTTQSPFSKTTALRVARLGAALALAFTLASARDAAAQTKGDVQISLIAQKVKTDAEGKEVLIAADTAKPGEVIQYDAVYLNKSRKEIHNLAPTLPIPAGMEFVAESAKPAPASASVDGKTFEAFPLVRKVTKPDGRIEEVPVPLSEYRALRWQVGDLAAGANTRVIARARLQTTVAKK